MITISDSNSSSNTSSSSMRTWKWERKEKKNAIYLLLNTWLFGHFFIHFEENGGVERVTRNLNFHPCNKLTLII